MVTPESASRSRRSSSKIGAVDVADHHALGRPARRLDEVGDLLRLVGIAAGMDVDRRSRLCRGDQRGLHHALFGVGPRRRAADLADHAGAHVGAPGADQDLADHLGGEVVDRAIVIARVLVVVDVVAAAHDQVHAGAGGDALQAVGVGRQAAAASARRWHRRPRASSSPPRGWRCPRGRACTCGRRASGRGRSSSARRSPA